MNDVLIRREGAAGRITLNRPAALNALTHDMVLRMSQALAAWADESSIGCVIVDGAGGKAFCAGGDLRGIYQLRADDPEPARRFWADEYRLNATIARYPKPYVALMHGIVMGGGVGVSAHGSHRIATENTLLAMPEVSVGFMPDVGGTWLLGRAPGRSGLYLALTGARIGAADAIWAGFADRFMPAAALQEFVQQVTACGDVDKVLSQFALPAETPPLRHRLSDIERAFSSSSPQDCLRDLHRMDSPWARETAASIRRNSPLSVACAFRAIDRASRFEQLEEALKLEYRFAYRSLAETDFREGIRSAIIDRDRDPQWNPRRIEDVDVNKMERLLSPLDGFELDI